MYIEEYINAHKDLFSKKYGDITVPYRLVDKGTKMTVHLESYCGDNAAFSVTHDSFSNDSMPKPVRLELKKDSDTYFADVEFEFNIPGNTKLEFWCGGQRIMRQIAVLDEGYCAVIPWIGSNIPFVDNEIHKYDLPGDFWLSLDVHDRWNDEKMAELVRFIENMHKYGDRGVPFFDAHNLAADAPNATVFELPREVQEESLAKLVNIMKLMGVETPELMACYTPDGVTLDILEKLGVKGLTSLCIWQNWRDGDINGWKINHHGAANQPYYPAPDDFRKNGEKRGIMCFSMGNSSCDRNYSIMAFSGCPSNAAPNQRYLENRVEHFQAERFYDSFDSFIDAAKHTDELLTLTVAIESFRGFSDWTAVNEAAIRYMAKKASKEKIVFVSAADIADYHIRNCLPMQKAYFFQPDTYYGNGSAEMPGHIDDRIEADTPEYLAVIKRSSMRPMFFFDYTDKWDSINFSEFGRNQYRLINPDTVDPSDCLPTQVESRDIRFSREWNGNTLTISAESDTPKKRMVTGEFDIPFRKGYTFAIDKADASATVINDTRGDNTHLFVDMGALKAGMNEVRITFKGDAYTPHNYVLNLGALGVMLYNGHAYLRSLDREQGISVSMTAPDGAYIVFPNGRELYAAGGKLEFTVNTDWYDEAPIMYGYDSELLKNADVKAEFIGVTKCKRKWI